MPFIYRKKRLVPIPPDAVPKVKRGVKGVEFRAKKRGTVWGEVKGDRAAVEDVFWTIRYTDSTGRVREIGSGTTERDKAEEMARDLSHKVKRQKLGLPVAPNESKHADATLLEHLEGTAAMLGYRQYLTDKGNTSRHVTDTVGKISRVLDVAQCLDSADVLRAIRSFGDLTGQTVNHYIRACKGFSRWLYRRKRAAEDHLRDLDLVDAMRDRVKFRRALTVKEFDAICKAADAQPRLTLENRTTFVLARRSTLYRLAVGTGFRAKEIRSLTPASLDLDADPPTVTVQAAYSKRNRRDVQPISKSLADLLRAYVKGRRKDAPLFDCDWARLAEVVRADCKFAGVPVKTAAGEIDFHALRHTYATWIASRTDAKTGQSLTRHSSAHLYLNVYAHSIDKFRARAVRSLP